MMAVRTIEVRERVLAKNDELAAQVRARLAAARVPAINLMSSPGAGKTTLLERTLTDLATELSLAVVTNGACHLDARQILTALDAIDLASTDLVFIENVGNLVCPASWDLGENTRVVLFSITEGEDKPVKYPKMFQQADTVVLTKLDLLPHVPFRLDQAMACLRRVNPYLDVISTSALTPDGVRPWYDFVRAEARPKSPR
jgi:hydrogenase nickel incorporation protein HypB